MLEFPVGAFALWSMVRTVLHTNHDIHLGGIPSLGWKFIPLELAINLAPGLHNLACRGIILVPLDITP